MLATAITCARSFANKRIAVLFPAPGAPSSRNEPAWKLMPFRSLSSTSLASAAFFSSLLSALLSALPVADSPEDLRTVAWHALTVCSPSCSCELIYRARRRLNENAGHDAEASNDARRGLANAAAEEEEDEDDDADDANSPDDFALAKKSRITKFVRSLATGGELARHEGQGRFCLEAK